MTDSERHTLRRELSGLIRRIAPDDHQSIDPLIGPLLDAIDAQHTHILLGDVTLDALTKHPTGNIVGQPDSNSPMVLWENRLYFRRYYNLEKRIANQLTVRNRGLHRSHSVELSQHLRQTFPVLTAQQINAIEIAQDRGLSIITGGPGTGKTTIIKALLTSALALNANLRAALAAPTGKAVARLEHTLEGLSIQQDRIEVKTLHRLLGYGLAGSTRYHRNRRLALDLVIIDEASMIDLNLADALLHALPDTAQLILIGDPNQLPSVNLGRLLSDLAQPLQSGGLLLEPAQSQLTENFRFKAQSGIDRLAQAIIDQRHIGLETDTTVQWLAPEKLDDSVLTQAFSAWIDCLRKPSAPSEFFAALDVCRILAPQHAGPRGVIAMNEKVVSILARLRLINLENPDYFHGQPLLILKNDYALNLFNGDVGFCIDPKKWPAMALDFPSSTGPIACFKHHREDGLRYLQIDALPEHETCFAMTVHKAQGSEFDEVLLVLDESNPESDHHLLTQELLYTGVTRAKARLKLVTTEQTWLRATQHRFERRSGLKAMLSTVTETL